MGAGLTVSEMMSSNPQVWESDKSRLRMVHIDEPGIRTVQIAGSDPDEMAEAARINVESGAQIIDINMAVRPKGESQVCRLGPVAIPGSGEVNPDHGGCGGGCSCHAENSHWLEKLSTTVFGQLSRKFPFRLSRMATLLTRLKPELLDYGCLMIGRAVRKTDSEIQHYLDTGELLARCLWQRLSACFARTFGNCMTFMVRQRLSNRA